MLRFFETNVLIYLFDGDAPAKKEIALALYVHAVREREALISVQVLQEFFVTVTHRLRGSVSMDQAERAVRDFSDLSIVIPDAQLVLDAIARSRRHRFSFWDSLIIEAAIRGGAKILYTEDLQDGRVIESLTVRNPFAA